MLITILVLIVFIFITFTALFERINGSNNNDYKVGYIVKVIMFIFCIAAIYSLNSVVNNVVYPAAIDVYRGKTTLEIRNNGKYSDSIVVYKNGERKDYIKLFMIEYVK